MKSNARALIHTTFERLEGVVRAGARVVIVVSVASWTQPKRQEDMLRTLKTFIGAVVVPGDFAFWGDTCAGNTGAPANKYRAMVALPAIASAAIDIARTPHRVAHPKDAARTLDLLHKKTMHPPAADEKEAAE